MRQNRVTPTGEIIASPSRGAFMGNRGRLHDARGRILRNHAGKRWIICRLEFKGRHREIMAPGAYTELFFLDEATALAAGHRPCAECMHARFVEFRRVWEAANPGAVRDGRVSAGELDAWLHAERLRPGGGQRTWRAPLSLVPPGAFVRMDPDPRPRLLWENRLLVWAPEGYVGFHELGSDREVEVEVLTPASTVNALRLGYLPVLDASATSL